MNYTASWVHRDFWVSCTLMIFILVTLSKSTLSKSTARIYIDLLKCNWDLCNISNFSNTTFIKYILFCSSLSSVMTCSAPHSDSQSGKTSFCLCMKLYCQDLKYSGFDGHPRRQKTWSKEPSYNHWSSLEWQWRETVHLQFGLGGTSTAKPSATVQSSVKATWFTLLWETSAPNHKPLVRTARSRPGQKVQFN